MEHVSSEKKFPVNANDYKLYEEIGEGVSATVHRALCVPLNVVVAIKILDLEKCNNDLDGTRREVQTMGLLNHPNVLRAYCSFNIGHNLWVVMPYMAGGSCLHIMKFAYPEGFEEPVIATLLREVLKALSYLHSHGHIHRDVKAGNILIDSNGAVNLADFGVSVCMFDAGDRQRSRNTFVGTPCWMAPEVMQQLHGYDFKADIWSFGITALELAHGHAPFSKYPPMKVLLMTLQNAPPGLDYERDKRFSKSFRDLVAACLVKDPKKRPTSEKLLKHHFFKNARSHEYLTRSILDGLLPLGERFRILKAKEADLLGQNKALNSDKEQLSQREYIRGISAWEFNLDDLKHQATLIQDDDDMSNSEDSNVGRTESDRHDDILLAKVPSLLRDGSLNDAYGQGLSQQCDGVNDLPNLENSLASFPIHPLQALNEDDANASSSNRKDAGQPDSDRKVLPQSSTGTTGTGCEKSDELSFRNSNLPHPDTFGNKKFPSSSLIHNNALSIKKNPGSDRESRNCHSERNYSGPLIYRQNKEISNPPTALDDTSEGAVVQRKGRFKVTSEELSPKGPKNCFFNPTCGGLAGLKSPGLPAMPVLPSLQRILQQNIIQRDEIIKLIKFVEQTSVNQVESDVASNGDLQVPPASSTERELQSRVIHLEQCVGDLVEEVQHQRMRNSELEKQVKALTKK